MLTNKKCQYLVDNEQLFAICVTAYKAYLAEDF